MKRSNSQHPYGEWQLVIFLCTCPEDDNNNESLGSPSFIIFTEIIRKLAMTVAITSTFAFNKYSETRPVLETQCCQGFFGRSTRTN